MGSGFCIFSQYRILLAIYLSSLYQSIIYLSTLYHLSTYLSIYLSDCLSIIYSSIHHLSINLPIIYQSIYPSSISHLSIIYFSTENWTLGLNYTRQVLFHHTPPTPSPYLASLMVQPTLGSNFQSPCLCLMSARMTGLCHCFQRNLSENPESWAAGS